MTTAKIQISVGAITFSGEGTEVWLEKQLDKLLASAPSLAAISPASDPASSDQPESKEIGALPSFLQKKSATKNQVRRFLATAEWLHLKGARRVQTAEITKALSEANQPRLGNPADCLNQNVSKGHCQTEGKTFFVTPEGRALLG